MSNICLILLLNDCDQNFNTCWQNINIDILRFTYWESLSSLLHHRHRHNQTPFIWSSSSSSSSPHQVWSGCDMCQFQTCDWRVMTSSPGKVKRSPNFFNVDILIVLDIIVVNDNLSSFPQPFHLCHHQDIPNVLHRGVWYA